jgi:GH15 family glucan-1,4-alpha-glucosidase
VAERLEAYALLGDMRSAALVSTSGTIDWLTFPRFDSAACCSALLGTEDDGRWELHPKDAFTTRRAYRGESMVLDTTFETAAGSARLSDCMPVDGPRAVVRLIEGLTGEIEFDCVLAPRFDYGSLAPWLAIDEGRGTAIGGPHALVLDAQASLRVEDGAIRSRFRVRAGERMSLVLTYYRSHRAPPDPHDAAFVLEATERFWLEWAAKCAYQGPHRDAVVRSLLVLKALTYAPTGAIVAAPTTSLPEAIGGVRNWDYRYCWLRDATFTVLALANASYRESARSFTDWLLRSIAGDPAKLQIVYGVAGERRLEEWELPWLPGYENSAPVRVGNAAFAQFQLDVYGEVLDALWQGVRLGLPSHPQFWALFRGIIDYVSENWERHADHGMWEIRGKPRHFVHSKVMAWVALDRVVRAVEAGIIDGPIADWRALRDRIRAEILARGFDAARNTFTQSYGSKDVDASLLLLTHVGFLPPDDPRIRGTIAAIEKDLYRAPFVARYPTSAGGNVDGLPGSEGAFLACSFWLADNFALMGREREANALFEALLELRNDVGLLSEEYDVAGKRLVGNFPQAFSHLALVNTAFTLSEAHKSPAEQRAHRADVNGNGAG